ncbi:palmitoyltransferase ZDHHC19-like [Urocitellus parryii]
MVVAVVMKVVVVVVVVVKALEVGVKVVVVMVVKFLMMLVVLVVVVMMLMVVVVVLIKVVVVMEVVEVKCRALVQNGEWVFPVASGLLCLLSLYSLISMNISDPGILHRGAFEQDPEAPYMARVNGRLYDMPWCPTCNFHRLPRTFHCESCDICVEEFDHHCSWVNNCVGHRNIRLYLLLLMSLCLYLGTVLATCVLFITRRRHMAFLDQTMTMTILVALPAGALLLPLILQLLIKAVAVGTARRPYEDQHDNPYNQGCTRNFYITLCASLGPKYMSEAVCLQMEQDTNWRPT